MDAGSIDCSGRRRSKQCGKPALLPNMIYDQRHNWRVPLNFHGCLSNSRCLRVANRSEFEFVTNRGVANQRVTNRSVANRRVANSNLPNVTKPNVAKTAEVQILGYYPKYFRIFPHIFQYLPNIYQHFGDICPHFPLSALPTCLP